MLNIYYIYQDENTDVNTYHAAVVIAESEEQAREMHPDGDWDRVDSWCLEPEDVKVRLLGKAKKNTEQSMVLSSYSWIIEEDIIPIINNQYVCLQRG